MDNPIRIAVDSAKEVLGVLKGHLDSLKDIGDANKVVNVTTSQNGVAANEAELKKVHNSLKGIVDVAEGVGVEKLKESKLTLAQQSIGVSSSKDGAKVLTVGAAGATVGDKATAIVSAVSGEEILAAIVKSQLRKMQLEQ